jgi:hypothetical protein
VSYDQDRQRAQAWYLRRLGPDAEVWLYLGADPQHARSVYKAFVRRTPRSPWWKFDVGLHGHPLKSQPPRPRAVRVIACTLSDLAFWDFDETRPALVALFDRAEDLHDR